MDLHRNIGPYSYLVKQPNLVVARWCFKISGQLRAAGFNWMSRQCKKIKNLKQYCKDLKDGHNRS